MKNKLHIVFLLIISSCSNDQIDQIREETKEVETSEYIIPDRKPHWAIIKSIHGKDTIVYESGARAYYEYRGDKLGGLLHICSQKHNKMYNYNYSITDKKVIEFRKEGILQMTHEVTDLGDQMIKIIQKDFINNENSELHAFGGDIIMHL